MAWVIFSNGERKTISREQSHAVWGMLNSEVKGTPEQEAFCHNIKKIYLNWRHAPDSYIKKNLPYVIAMHVSSDWLVDKHSGLPTRPWEEESWSFAKRWGLWRNGKKTSIALEDSEEIKKILQQQGPR